MKSYFPLATSFFLVCLCATAYAAEPPQADSSKAILVLDSSGSMWGQIDGKTKIEIARAVTKDLLQDLDPNLHLGLFAYGHRRKGDCTDIESLISPATVDKSKFLTTVNGLTPKGKTPLSDAVIKAAEELRFTEDKATVILVSDGVETCEMDPCEVGKKLEQRGIDFTTHVIGFDLKEGEEKQLRCLAESTGGQFFAAKDAAGLQEALGTAVQAASKPVEHNLLLTGKEAETDKLLRDGIKWSIYSSKEDEHPKETLTGPKARFKLEPGTYTVSGTWKDITAEKQITVVEDKVTEEEFVFGVGRLKVSGRQSEGGKKITEKIEWNVYKKQESSDERAEHVALTYGSSREFRLPPGDYVVEGTLGGTKSEKITSLQSGKTSELVLIFGVGTLKLSAFKSEGGTKITRNIGWQLYEQLENGERGKRLQVFGGATKTMPLATGSYVVEGGYGEAKAEEAFVIEAEKTTDVAVIFGVGKIKTSGTKGEGGAAITKSISWQVHKPSDDPDELGARVTTKGGSTMTSKLPTGDYVLKATYGYQTRRVPFTIAAERTTELVVPFEVGKLKISGLKAEGGAPVRESISWNIYPKGEDEDELGRRIDSKGGSEYKRALPAGDYIVKATYGEAKARKNVTIQTGETTTDVLVFNSAKLKLEAASPRGVQWAVFAEPEDDTDERERITSGGGKSKSFVIPAGKYLIEATSAGEKKQVRVELAAGDKKTVDVAFE